MGEVTAVSQGYSALVLTLKAQVLHWGGSGDEEPIGVWPLTLPQ